MLQHVLIIGFVWPEPASSAAGSRMLQLIDLFRGQDWKITFASAALDSDFMANLSDLGVITKQILLNDTSFDLFVKELQPSIVVFDRFMVEEQFGWRVALNCPDALRILDTEDLHCLRRARQLAYKQKRPFEDSDLFSDIAKREMASILRCDLSLIISETEMDFLRRVFKIDDGLIHYLPFLMEPITPEITYTWPDYNERHHFVFIGNFHHEPNRDAVLCLKEKIWPAIRKQLPDAELHIYGAYIPQHFTTLHHPKTGFHIMGRAGNAAEVVQKARVMLAPLLYGAGIKGKLAEAMLCGTPSVTTGIGAESMHDDSLWNGFITDDMNEFANKAIILYNDENIWRASCQNGIHIFNNRYLKSKFGPALINRIMHLIEIRETHRTHNFTGSMLLYHTMMGTKYMALWIEEKNKRN